VKFSFYITFHILFKVCVRNKGLSTIELLKECELRQKHIGHSNGKYNRILKAVAGIHNLYMNGCEIFISTLKFILILVRDTLAKNAIQQKILAYLCFIKPISI